MTVIKNRFTTNIDYAYTDDTTGVSVKPSLLLDFSRLSRADTRLTSVRSGSATVIGKSKYIENVLTNTQRITYDPVTGECMGLLVEENRTNVVRNALSEQGSYVSTDTTIGPDRNTTLRAVPTGSVTAPGVGLWGNQSFSLVQTVGATKDFSYSGYFAPYGPLAYKPYIVIGAVGTSLTTVYATLSLDPTNGTFPVKLLDSGWSEVVAPKAVLHPSGFYYVTWTVRFTQPSTYSAVNNYLQILNQANSQIYTADGVSGFKYSCLQFEEGSFSSSYIPTTTASVNRGSDLITYPVGSWYNPSEGTLYAEFKYGDRPQDSRIASIESSSINHISLMGSNSGLSTGPYFEIRDNNATAPFAMGPGPTVANSKHMVAASYSAGSYKFYVNGTNVYTNSYSAVPQNLTTLFLGSKTSAGFLNGYLYKFAYYPKAFSTEELRVMTTL